MKELGWIVTVILAGAPQDQQFNNKNTMQALL